MFWALNYYNQCNLTSFMVLIADFACVTLWQVQPAKSASGAHVSPFLTLLLPPRLPFIPFLSAEAVAWRGAERKDGGGRLCLVGPSCTRLSRVRRSLWHGPVKGDKTPQVRVPPSTITSACSSSIFFYLGTRLLRGRHIIKYHAQYCHRSHFVPFE